MGDRNQGGGYGNSSGEDFISFGSDNSGPSQGNTWHRGRRPPPQMQRISGTQRSHQSFMERKGPNQPYSNRGGRWNNRGSNFRDSHQPYQQRGGGSFRGGEGGFGHKGGGYGHRGGHQGPRNRSKALEHDISDYFHPSMVEDPWRELETLLKVPDADRELSDGEPRDSLDKEADSLDQDSNDSIESESAD
ncbi:M-phase-specific PLK1-interacting protein [Frankliniella fusca]|uniref:M-phase-specific PLK1-interacting protein n=1 Tax=Frankliniella fusca TaxID=407009 RepID=A0AAE1LIV4_9NEOP|nr:M-phase-specific PLK1-interacting protein [Frankliniella fusca]